MANSVIGRDMDSGLPRTSLVYKDVAAVDMNGVEFSVDAVS